MKVYHLQSYKKAKAFLKDVNKIVRIIDESGIKLFKYHNYAHVESLLIEMANARILLEEHKERATKAVSIKGRIK